MFYNLGARCNRTRCLMRGHPIWIKCIFFQKIEKNMIKNKLNQTPIFDQATLRRTKETTDTYEPMTF